VLAGLAVGSLVWGLPLSGGARFENFLEPIFRTAEENLARMTAFGARELGVEVPPAPAHDFAAMLPGYLIALVIALIGFGIAWYTYLGPGKAIPAKIAQGAPGLYRAFANKFYVDELYHYAVVVPLKATSRFLWQVV